MMSKLLEMLAVCLLCIFLKQVVCTPSLECCKGCEMHYTGTASHLVSSTQIRTKHILVKYQCGAAGKLWYGERECYTYRLVYYMHTNYVTRYCKTVGMRCKPGCEPPQPRNSLQTGDDQGSSLPVSDHDSKK